MGLSCLLMSWVGKYSRLADTQITHMISIILVKESWSIATTIRGLEVATVRQYLWPMTLRVTAKPGLMDTWQVLFGIPKE